MLVLGTLAMLLVSCGTSAPRYNYKELARASIRLQHGWESPTVAVVTANGEWTVPD